MDSQSKNDSITLRIQLTPSDNCNLSCFYCCKEGSPSEYTILRDENIVTFVRAFKEVLNIKKIRYTGGEPLLYKASRYSQEPSLPLLADKINDLGINQSIVTNGTRPDLIRKIVEKPYSFETTISLSTLRYDAFRQLTYCEKESDFANINKSIQMFVETGTPLKLNYVLVNGFNTNKDDLKSFIDKYSPHSNIKIRFLELVVNQINNQNNLNKYVFNEMATKDILQTFGFHETINTRAFSILKNTDDVEIKIIKFYCNNDCISCPEGKKSFWLTPEGVLRKCCFGNVDDFKITNWTYTRLVHDIFNYANRPSTRN